MLPGDLFLQIFATFLGGYLSLSSALAIAVGGALERYGIIDIPDSPTVATMDSGSGVGSEDLAKVPSRYEIGGAIPRILLDNLEYQQAAVAGAGSGRAAATSSERVKIEDALVNVFCSYREGDNRLHATTGSGVFIDERGVILTNAHVAQFLLLEGHQKDARCVIRQGNPAESRYVADILYISPAWVYTNARLIDAEAPSGTGERDFALLYVKEAISGGLPEQFPSLAFSARAFRPGDENLKAYAAGYPAAIFGEEGPRAELPPVVDITTLTEFFTFGSGEADIMAVAPSAVGEQGASGGPVVSKDGAVIGLIVTRGNEEKEGTHSLRALSLDYIDRAIQEETGFDLSTTLEGNISRRSQIFKNALAPFLARLLEDEMRN